MNKDFLEYIKGKQDITIKGNFEEIRATTVLGLRYKDGILLLSDSQATSMPTLLKWREPVRKVEKIDEHTIIGYAGFPEIAFNTGRILRIFLSDEQCLEGELTSLAKINILARTIKQTFPMVLSTQGSIAAEFILACYDPRLQTHFLFSCDPSGFSSNHDKYTAIGSGGEHAQSVLDVKYRKRISRDECLKLGIEALKCAQGRNAGTSEPFFGIELSAQVKEIPDSEIKSVLKKIIETEGIKDDR